MHKKYQIAVPQIRLKMVIGLLSIAAIPTVTGVGQAISAQKRQNAASKEREQFNTTALLPEKNGNFQEKGTCLLRDGRMVINTPDSPATGHKFCGFYFKYPGEEGHLGLVSTVSNETRMLNWIYVDRDTHAVRYGTRKETVGQIIGPWGFNDNETLLTLDGNTGGFVTKRESFQDTEIWVVYWEPEGDSQDSGTSIDCMLRRRPLLGVESTYVKDKDKTKN